MGRHAGACDEEVRSLSLLHLAIAACLVVGPLLLGVGGVVRSARARARAPEDAPSFRSWWDWRLTASSLLLYTLAFNLTFFIQELFLVIPKALAPGLEPTLYHNNHSWEGDHPLVGLLQGTGALAILATGLLALALLRFSSRRNATVQLFLVWMAYNGIFQALSQLVMAAIFPANDVGMALDHLGFSSAEKLVTALSALVLIPIIALALPPHLLALATAEDRATSPRTRTRHIFLIATLPAFLAILLIIPFRIPREWIEVAVLPVIVTWMGIVWMQAGAWRAKAVPFLGRLDLSVAIPLSAVITLLVLFQLILRPGISF